MSKFNFAQLKLNFVSDANREIGKNIINKDKFNIVLEDLQVQQQNGELTIIQT